MEGVPADRESQGGSEGSRPGGRSARWPSFFGREFVLVRFIFCGLVLSREEALASGKVWEKHRTRNDRHCFGSSFVEGRIVVLLGGGEIRIISGIGLG